MARIEDILQDEAFLKKVLACGTQEEVKALFKEKDYDISDEELNDLREFFAGAIQVTRKMKPEELEQAVGGVGDDIREGKEGTVDKSIAVGDLVGAGLGAYVGYRLAKKAAEQGKDIRPFGYVWRTVVGAVGGTMAGTRVGRWVGILIA